MTHQRRQPPSSDVFARSLHMIVERHYFGKHKKASLGSVQTEADKAYLTLSKRLLNMPEVTAIDQRDSQFRKWMGTVATPFRPGLWLVPVGMVERVDAAAQVWQRERDELADAAALVYPLQVNAMREPLGPLFNPLDYPTTEIFRSHYSVAWRFINFGVPDVLREIRTEVFERERQKLEEAGAEAREMIEQHLASSALKLTNHLVDLLRPRANGRKPALRDGALDNMLSFLDTIAVRDVTNFRELQAVTERLRRATRGLTVDSLRSDDALRDRTATLLEEAREAVTALVVDDSPRTIRIREEEPEAVV